MQIRNLFIVLSFFLPKLFISCAKLPTYESKKPEQEMSVNSSYQLADQTDSKKNIDYGTSTDGSNLYLQMCFHNQEDLLKIMNGGLNIYFDKSCKKKKDWVLSIERVQRMRPDSKPMMGKERPERPPFGEESPNGVQVMPEQEMNESIADRISREFSLITWKKDDSELVFDGKLHKDKIVVNLEPYNYTYLMLTVKMPFTEIELHPGEMLALGTETSKMTVQDNGLQGERPQRNGEFSGPPGGSRGMGMGSSPSGPVGMPDGPGGSGGPGGMQNNINSSTSPFKFWFLAKL